MNKGIQTALLIAGGVLGLGFAISGTVRARVRRARDELFEIGPDCEWIRFRGFGDSPDEGEIDDHIATAREYYFAPLIAQLKAQGKTTMQVRVAVLEDLFPECVWPPEDMLSTHGVIWGVLGRWVELEAMRGDVCDPLGDPPVGMICVERDGAHVLEREGM